MTADTVVPCNGCTLCCRRDVIRILPHEDPRDWLTEPHALWPDELMLGHAPNGDCIYLLSNGCAIHPRRPQMCRDMDCRAIAGDISERQIKNLQARGLVSLDVWLRGRELLGIEDAK